MISSTLFTILSSLVIQVASDDSSKYSSEASFVQFDQLGFSGRYFPVTEVEALSDGNCTCSKDLDNPLIFNGTNSPFNEELSVHLRGPMNLRKFAWYVADEYEYGSTSGSWTRAAYYDSEAGTADNVTFLGNVGANNTCLGNALNYVSEDGVTEASESTVLGNITVPSNEEFAIYSGTKCSDPSSLDGDCGVYRDGIDAYHGFPGTVKAFLFEFWSPSDLSEESLKNKTWNYDMPGIWLLNAEIPRTAQYPLNGNCSAWNTGAGEFDIFEVMNVTERNHFYTTIHDYQGIEDLGTGIEMYAYLERTPESVMRGGLVLGSDGTATVFLSNSTTFNETIDSSDLSSWISSLKGEDGGEHSQELPSITLGALESTSGSSSTATGSSSSSSSKSKGGAAVVQASNWLSSVLFILGAMVL
ncbi:DEKNAAC100113 [Brettanomyces naardenensis]|uniref:glucan endo-1,3-beta-D-glucosidase n=1 Tax=Brettanomyces naardenensis TaxID=13370 RepID=A0A448YEY2_BRENA|nr:DEKNAAC100113 [Brettanomyces naardenensis]